MLSTDVPVSARQWMVAAVVPPLLPLLLLLLVLVLVVVLEATPLPLLPPVQPRLSAQRRRRRVAMAVLMMLLLAPPSLQPSLPHLCVWVMTPTESAACRATGCCHTPPQVTMGLLLLSLPCCSRCVSLALSMTHVVVTVALNSRVPRCVQHVPRHTAPCVSRGTAACTIAALVYMVPGEPLLFALLCLRHLFRDPASRVVCALLCSTQLRRR